MTNNKLPVFKWSVLLVLLGAMSAQALGDITVTRVSENAAGEQGNNGSFHPSISADGQLVTFSSFASNLIPDDTNQGLDIFVKNVGSGEIVWISDKSRFYTSISADGRFMAFVSEATNLVPGDTNDAQVFVENLETGEIVRVSEDAVGVPGNSDSHAPSLSADGRFVVFESDSSNLVPGDSNNLDVYVKTVATGEIVRASEDAAGIPGNRGSGGSNDDTNNVGSKVSISADGRLVAFLSGSTNLVPDDTNLADDVFVKNVRTGEIVRVSEDAAGIQGNYTNGSWGISISADGRFVAFTSQATNLILDETDESDDPRRNVDVFVNNLETGEIMRVSQNAAGDRGNSDSQSPSLSADGNFVVFSSSATNLVLNDTNDSNDVFLADIAGVRTPTKPGDLRFAVYSRTAAEVFWDRSSDNGGILYEVIRNGELIGVFDALSVFEDELQPGIGYTYLVTAIDNDGNRSATATVSFTTNDTETQENKNPPRPGNLRFIVYSKTAAELYWDRPVGRAYLYRVYFNGVLVAETDGVSWWSEDFTPGSTTEVMVNAVDSNGVESSPAVVIVQTTFTSLSPVTGLRAEVYSATAAELFWDRAPGINHYRVYADGVEVATTDGTSWFSDDFGAGSTTRFTVVAFKGENESAEQSVTVTTHGGNAEIPVSSSYEIGDTGPGGGIVFRVNADGTSGFEAAPMDQSRANWCSPILGFAIDVPGVVNLGLATAIDPNSGAANTAMILGASSCRDTGSTAAEEASTYVWPNGQMDGFLPNKEELDLLFNQKAVVGGFADDFYWSSSEFDVFDAWFQNFSNDTQIHNSKGNGNRVRAIRAF